MEGNQGRVFMTMIRRIFFLSVLITAVACDPNTPISEIPNVPVDVTINLSNQQYIDLQLDGGWAYLNNEGVRGIILYRQSETTYLAFERNCSFRAADACATVDVHSTGFYMEDVCCGSTFDFNGIPSGGPAALPLRQYFTLLDGQFLTIRNAP